MKKETRQILLTFSYLGLGYCVLHLWRPISFPINIPFLPGYEPPGETGIIPAQKL